MQPRDTNGPTRTDRRATGLHSAETAESGRGTQQAHGAQGRNARHELVQRNRTAEQRQQSLAEVLALRALCRSKRPCLSAARPTTIMSPNSP